jgi:hypothetical protein
MSYKIKTRREIHELVEKFQKEISAFTPVIVICGEGPCRDYFKQGSECDKCPESPACPYNLRLRIRDRLRSEGCLASLFEENKDIAYASMDERLILRDDEVDLVVVFPTSMGSASELGSFAMDKMIKKKLRVLVPHEYHPFYGSSDSYLTSVYKELMAEYGHVYPYSLDGKTHPDPSKILSTLVSVYKRFKLLELAGTGNNNS